MRLPTIISVSKLQNWNLLIKESSSKEQWLEVFSHYHEMRRAGVPLVDPTLFPPILKACTNLKSLKQGTSVHGCVIKQGFESFTSIGNSTMDFYVKCGFMSSALGVFASMENKDSVSWNVMIHGYFNQGFTSKEEGLYLFMQARVAGFEPNISTLVLVLQAYRDLKATHQALGFHGFIIRSGFVNVVSVQNSLLCLYTESGDMEFAQKLFDEMFETDVISWSVMIGGHVQSGEGLIAVRLFQEMFSVNGIEPDERTVVSVLKACASIKDIDLGRLIHGYVIRRGFNCDIFVGNSLIDIYSKCLYATSAIKVFNEMPRRNIVSWNSILSGFVYNEWYSEALRLYSSMEKAGIDADEVTLVTLLQSCKNLVDPARCKSIHSRVIRRGFDSNELVENSLIDAYAKCNLVELAWKLFERMEKRDMISWSTMITAFSHSGNTDEALALFQEMMCVQGKFNAVTILSLFEACAVSAELRRCKWAHGLAIRSGLSTEVAVATALLDMYSKCGEIEISRRVFDHMHERNIVSWSAMIAAYGMNGGVREALALLTEMELQGLKPNGVTLLSVLSACSHGGLVEEGKSLFEKLTNDHEFKPRLEHYSCMVDMLGRAGTVDSAMDLIKKMPEGIMGGGEGASLWGALLSACKKYGNSEVGETVASRVLKLEPMKSSGYLLASSIYASNGLWDEAAKMRRLVKEKGVKVISGYSLVHVGNKAYKFVAGDGSHQKSQEIHSVVKQLHSCMKKEERNGLFVGTWRVAESWKRRSHLDYLT